LGDEFILDVTFLNNKNLKMKNNLIKSVIAVLFLSISLNAQIINEFSSANNSIKNIKGKAYDWIEIYNNTEKKINLLDYSLTDDVTNPRKWLFPSTILNPNEYLLIWASGKNIPLPNGQLQTNFKIKSKGESIYFHSPTGKVIDKTPSTRLYLNHSLGRILSDPQNWYYFEIPTPSKANMTKALKDYVLSPKILTQSGFYENNIEVKIISQNPHDKIYYTLDGTIPTQNSRIFNNKLILNKSAVVRVKAFRIGAVSSKILSKSYFIKDKTSLGVVSLITDKNNFWGTSGIYSNPYSRQEVPVHIEYFTKDKKLAFSQDVGVKIHSPDSRRQKSLRLYARDKYGKSRIKFKIFKDKDLSSFKRLILRNGGNDGLEKGKTQVRDAFVHKLYQKQNIENGISSFEFVEVYINGKYWGIYNLRERQDEHYLKDNFGYNEDEVDFLEYDYQEPHYKKTIAGDWEDWEKLKDFLIHENMTSDENYKIAKNWIDINNFIDYQIFEIFIGNQDWANNNIKFWCPKEDGGKWKWVLWDTDFALGTQRKYPVGKPNHNFIHMALTYGGWGSGDYTWMFRNLMKNEMFKKEFIVRYQDLLNSIFSSEFTSSTFNSLINVIKPEIKKQFNKWGRSKSIWENDIEYTINFLNKRPSFCRTNLAKEFIIDGSLFNIQLDIGDMHGGLIKLNSLNINDEIPGWIDKTQPWEGSYFTNQEVNVIAIPKFGYHFDHWEGDIEEKDISKDTLIFLLTKNTSLKAIFKRDEVNLPKLFINEIMSSNKNAFEDDNGEFSDWIEIFNPSDKKIDLSGLYLTDDLSQPDKYKVPSGLPDITVIKPKGYLTIIADNKESDSEYLHLNFKLKKRGEAFGIYYKDLNNFIVIDTISFPVLAENKSFGRLPDGGEDWVVFSVSTPNSMNEMIFPDFVKEQNSNDGFNIFPNPFINNINIEFKAKNANSNIDLYILNIHGRIIFQYSLKASIINRIDLSSYKTGVYIVKLVDLSGSKVMSKKIIKIN